MPNPFDRTGLDGDIEWPVPSFVLRLLIWKPGAHGAALEEKFVSRVGEIFRSWSLPQPAIGWALIEWYAKLQSGIFRKQEAAKSQVG